MADINPASMATQLATAYTQPTQSLITTQTKAAQTASSALSKLQSALRAFDSALASLSSKSSVQQYAATFSASTYGSATANNTAQPGSYSVFVEQLATTNQVAYSDLPAVPVATGGPINVNLADGSSFSVNLSAADQDGDGTLSQAEIARAINQAGGNGGKVTAMIVTVGGSSQLVMSSGQSGQSGAITLDASALPVSTLKDSLSAPTQLVAAQDAIVWLGAQGSGIKLQQSTNTFTAIQGVSMTFTQKMNAGDAPMTLTVASDAGGTASNVKSFVDAYNTLEKALDELTKSGDAKTGADAAPFASDSGIRALRERLTNLIRQDFGGLKLMDFGVSADRYGVLSVDTTKLNNALTAHPGGLDQVLGKASLTNSSGLLGSLDKYMDVWLSSTNGQIKNRQTSVGQAQKTLAQRQARLDDQYNNFYQRYLQQFSQLQTLQSQMSQTSGIMNNLFTSA
ncbi:MAG: flagellar filament capping protein FliD [Acidobacteriota bacterium]